MAHQNQVVEPTPRATCAVDILKKVNEHGLVGYAWPAQVDTGEGDLKFVRECEDKGWLTWAYDLPEDRGAPHRSIFTITLAGRQALYLFTHEAEGSS